ncbi:MAG: hypothetical protein HY959_08830 [Ignavibacteriae bacterium]|nr:hypothetical protein [Ignavibacteriota bacterium]
MTDILNNNDVLDAQKKEFIEGPFCYETNMLIYSFFKFLQLQIIINENEKNVSLETFILHGRILYEFYFFNNRYKDEDDAKAFDFIDINKLNNIRNSLNLSKKDFEYKFKSNKQLAHLTYTRLNYDNTEEKNWKIEEIMKEFVYISKFFINELSDDYKGANIRKLQSLLDNSYFLNEFLKDS